MGLIDFLGLTRKITRPRIREFLARYATGAPVLDVGCGNDVYTEIFPNRTTFDCAPRPGVRVDIVGDAHDMRQIPDASYGVVLCSEVLEHLHTPSQAIREFLRVLKPGGLLLLTTRFVYPLHDTPGDYYRFTRYGLQHLLQVFDIIEFREEASTMETFAVLCQRIGFQCDTLHFRGFKLVWFALAQVLRLFTGILSREYGDISHRHPERSILCSGYYVAARKPA